MCYFITILRMTAVFAFIAYKYEMEEKSIWKQKSDTASNSACPLGIKSGRATARPAQFAASGE